MLPFGNIIFICWVIYYLYWIIAAFSTKQTQEIKWDAGSLWWNIGIFVVFLFFKNIFLLIPHSQVLSVFSLFCVIVGLITAVTARYTLAGNWSKDVVLKKDHTLITTGIYKYIRHPIYSGFLLMGIGTTLYVGTIGVILLFIILTVFLTIKFQKEEELLSSHFSKEYSEYKKKSKKLIPFIF